MRRLYRSFFYAPKHEKVRDNVMLARAVVFVTVIVICLSAMSFAAYAHFSHTVTSPSNIIKATTFKIAVSVQKFDDAGNIIESIPPITTDYKSYRIPDLKAGETYTVTLEYMDSNMVKTGFVELAASGCKEIYHTCQLGIDENVQNGETKVVTFKLTVDKPTDLIMKTYWGTSSYYAEYLQKGDGIDFYITQNKTVNLAVIGAESVSENNGGESVVGADDNSSSEEIVVEGLE